jgi:hypothetical protein
MLFFGAKSLAARGIPFREFVTETVKDKLAAEVQASEKPWLKHMGKLKHLRKETCRINRLVEGRALPPAFDAALKPGSALRSGSRTPPAQLVKPRKPQRACVLEPVSAGRGSRF